MENLRVEGQPEIEVSASNISDASDALTDPSRQEVPEAEVPEAPLEASEQKQENEAEEVPELKKGLWRTLREKFGGEKVRNFYEATDVEKKVASSEVFKNRESLLAKDALIGIEVASVSTQYETQMSKVRQAENKIKDAEAIYKTRLELAKAAGVDSRLAIEEKHKASLSVHQEEKIRFEAEAKKILAVKNTIEERRKLNQDAINAENSGLRNVVDVEVEKVKAGTNYEQRKSQVEAMRLEIESDQKQHGEVFAQLARIEAILASPAFSEEEKRGVSLDVSALKRSRAEIDERLGRARLSYNKLSEGLSVVEKRISAIKGVEAKLGFVDSNKKEEDKKPESKTATTAPASTSGGVSFTSAEEKFDDKSSFEYQKVKGEGEKLLSLLGKVPQEGKNIPSYIKEVLDLSNVLYAYLGNEYPQLNIALLDMKKALRSQESESVKTAISKFAPVVRAVFNNNFNQ